MKGVILDHAYEDSWLSGSVEMVLDSAFGQEIVNVRLVHTKIKRSDKTSMVGREATLTFVMDMPATGSRVSGLLNSSLALAAASFAGSQGTVC